MDGKVVRLMKDKSFGFIRGEDGRDYFFHATSIKNSRFETLSVGDEVTFEESEGSKGHRADDVFVS